MILNGTYAYYGPRQALLQVSFVSRSTLETGLILWSNHMVRSARNTMLSLSTMNILEHIRDTYKPVILVFPLAS